MAVPNDFADLLEFNRKESFEIRNDWKDYQFEERMFWHDEMTQEVNEIIDAILKNQNDDDVNEAFKNFEIGKDCIGHALPSSEFNIDYGAIYIRAKELVENPSNPETFQSFIGCLRNLMQKFEEYYNEESKAILKQIKESKPVEKGAEVQTEKPSVHLKSVIDQIQLLIPQVHDDNPAKKKQIHEFQYLQESYNKLEKVWTEDPDTLAEFRISRFEDLLDDLQQSLPEVLDAKQSPELKSVIIQIQEFINQLINDDNNNTEKLLIEKFNLMKNNLSAAIFKKEYDQKMLDREYLSGFETFLKDLRNYLQEKTEAPIKFKTVEPVVQIDSQILQPESIAEPPNELVLEPVLIPQNKNKDQVLTVSEPNNISEDDARARTIFEEIDQAIGPKANIQPAEAALKPAQVVDQADADRRLDQLASQIDETLVTDPSKLGVVIEEKVIKPNDASLVQPEPSVVTDKINELLEKGKISKEQADELLHDELISQQSEGEKRKLLKRVSAALISDSIDRELQSDAITKDHAEQLRGELVKPLSEPTEILTVSEPIAEKKTLVADAKVSAIPGVEQVLPTTVEVQEDIEGMVQDFKTNIVPIVSDSLVKFKTLISSLPPEKIGEIQSFYDGLAERLQVIKNHVEDHYQDQLKQGVFDSKIFNDLTDSMIEEVFHPAQNKILELERMLDNQAEEVAQVPVTDPEIQRHQPDGKSVEAEDPKQASEPRIIKPSTGPKTPLTSVDVDALQEKFGNTKGKGEPTIPQDDLKDLLVEAAKKQQTENPDQESLVSTSKGLEQEKFNPTKWYNETIIKPFNFLDDQYSWLLEQTKGLSKEQKTADLFNKFKDLNELVDYLQARALELGKEFKKGQDDLEQSGNVFSQKVELAHQMFEEIEKSISELGIKFKF
ncbi:MAG: hypothetical protein WC669_03590 [Patescibacteria group bacterium]